MRAPSRRLGRSTRPRSPSLAANLKDGLDRADDGRTVEEAHRAHPDPRNRGRYRRRAASERSPSSSTGQAAFTAKIRLPRRRRGQRNSTPALDVIAAVRELALIASDDLIAGLLNRNGLKTGHGNRWTRERVTSLRSHHRSPVFKTADDGVEPWLNLSDAARLLRIASKTLRLAAEAGKIEARHPFAGTALGSSLEPRLRGDAAKAPR